MKTVLWEKLRGKGTEYCEFRFLPVTNLKGYVITDCSGEPYFVSYSVECDEFGATQSVSVFSQMGGHQQNLELYRSQDDEWFCDGTELPQFRGLKDIDLGLTPSTNTLAIRRLKLSPGQSAEITAVWIQFPKITITTLDQRYTCIDTNSYLYESIKSGYRAHLAVDQEGVATEYQNEWRQI